MSAERRPVCDMTLVRWRRVSLTSDAQNLHAATDQGVWRLRLATQLLPTSTSTPTPTSTPLISGLQLVADPTNYSGPCPAVIHFTGQISGSVPYARLRYRWIRGDGGTVPESSLNFDGSGSASVNATWSLAGQTQFAGWEVIQILSTTQEASDQANFSVSYRLPTE